MKMFSKLLATLLLVVSLFNVGYSQLNGGLGLKLNFGIPSNHYGWFNSANSSFSPDYSLAWGLSLDSRWYVFKTADIGVAVNASWLDLAYAGGSNNDYKWHTADISMFGVGPLFTYKIATLVAADVYYNLRPGVMATYANPKNDDDDWLLPVSYGISHAVGAAMRFSKLQVGFEYKFGKQDDIRLFYDGDSESVDDEEMVLNNFRFFVGLKL